VTLRSCIALAAIGLAAPGSADNPLELSRTAYLMGTRVTLTARAADHSAAAESLESLLRSLEQSEDLLSTWRRDTAFGSLNGAAVDEPVQIDRTLCDLFGQLVAWRDRTGGAFDPAVGPLVDAWGIERQPRVPSDAEIARLVPASRLTSWRFDPAACTVTRPPGGRLDSGGFGKGAAFDAATRLDLPARGWSIDLGGQVGVHGHTPRGGWRVGIAHPQQRDREVFTALLKQGSLATSGGSERDRRVGSRRIGHILDPRTGRPADYEGSVVVWHKQGLAADILSTALYIMGPEEGLPWAEGRQIAACFLLPGKDEMVIRSTERWKAIVPN
jgi:FAD:protein FMN transferase